MEQKNEQPSHPSSARARSSGYGPRIVSGWVDAIPPAPTSTESQTLQSDILDYDEMKEGDGGKLVASLEVGEFYEVMGKLFATCCE
jgi:hypothetical protein